MVKHKWNNDYPAICTVCKIKSGEAECLASCPIYVQDDTDSFGMRIDLSRCLDPFKHRDGACFGNREDLSLL